MQLSDSSCVTLAVLLRTYLRRLVPPAVVVVAERSDAIGTSYCRDHDGGYRTIAYCSFQLTMQRSTLHKSRPLIDRAPIGKFLLYHRTDRWRVENREGKSAEFTRSRSDARTFVLLCLLWFSFYFLLNTYGDGSGVSTTQNTWYVEEQCRDDGEKFSAIKNKCTFSQSRSCRLRRPLRGYRRRETNPNKSTSRGLWERGDPRGAATV